MYTYKSKVKNKRIIKIIPYQIVAVPPTWMAIAVSSPPHIVPEPSDAKINTLLAFPKCYRVQDINFIAVLVKKEWILLWWTVALQNLWVWTNHSAADACTISPKGQRKTKRRTKSLILDPNWAKKSRKLKQTAAGSSDRNLRYGDLMINKYDYSYWSSV